MQTAANPSLIQHPPALRRDPWQPDATDPMRIQWGRALFHSQDHVLRARDKQIEENIRMLCGQHHIVWNDVLGRWYDISRYLTNAQQLWYYRPVVNLTLFWFMLTHARMTENPPLITFQPSTLDRIDAMLAEVMDPIWKRDWRRIGMEQVNDRIAAWLLAGGEAFAISRIDQNLGELEEWVGPAMLPILGPDGNPAGEEYVEAVPYGPDGQPLAEITPDGRGWQATGAPHAERSGGIDVSVLSPFQCRGEWSTRRWEQKRWHAFISLEPIHDLEENFGVRVDPDAGTDSLLGMQMAEMLMGSGHYGATSQRPGSEGLITNFAEGYALTYTLYHRPSKLIPGTEESTEGPGGRRLIFTRQRVLYDGPREARFPNVSPIRRFQFLSLPGRPAGSTPQEAINPINRAYNKGYSQILLHRDRMTNPLTIVDEDSGITKEDMTGEPGLTLKLRRRGTIPPVEYVSPQRLSEQVFETQQMVLNDLRTLGSLEGAEGRPPTTDPSSALVRELRFNSDRYLGGVQRNSVTEYARMAEDWMALYEILIDQEKAISYAGQDQVVNTITVFPMLFEQGRVNVIPDIESMLPEGRGERETKVFALYREGAFGPVGDPMASQKLLELFRFPHLGRAARPGGVDAVTAQQENGDLALGMPALQIPVYPWYDHLVHLTEHEKFMKSPEFKTVDPRVQQEFMLHWQQHQMLYQQQVLAQQEAAEQSSDEDTSDSPTEKDA